MTHHTCRAAEVSITVSTSAIIWSQCKPIGQPSKVLASMSDAATTQISRSYGCSRAGWNFASAANSGSAARATVVVIPGGTDHEAWFREDTEVIDSSRLRATTSYSAANPPT